MRTSHPKGLYLLFVTEMWERFSYYGMRAIFFLFLTKALLFTHEDASNIYGDFTGLVYLTPLLGGYISDRYWGNRRSIVFGGLLMAIGQFFLFLSSTYYHSSFALSLMIIGLLFLVVGNGFFKPNISTMVGQLYAPGDARTDAAYTIFYMGINLGAFFSPLICGTLGDTSNPADFRWGFLSACIGMLVGLALFLSLKGKYLNSYDGRPVGLKPVRKNNAETGDGQMPFNFRKVAMSVGAAALLYLLFYYLLKLDVFASLIFSFCLVIPAYIITDPSLTKVERSRILVIYILAFFVLFFWAAYEQAGASLTTFTDESVDRVIDNHEIKTSYFQSVNPIFIFILAPFFSMLWTWLEKRHLHIGLTQKQAMGMLLLSAGYMLLAYGTQGVPDAVKVSMFWILSYYFLSTVGELCLSPIGLSMVTKLSPARFSSLLMGVWLMSTAAADKCCGMLSALYPTDHSVGVFSFLHFTISSKADFFMMLAIMTFVAALILFLVSKKLNNMMKME
jgi:POT family proton-dependent oligopeptide transporter